LPEDAVGVKTCAALHCWASISSSEYYCSSHRNIVGERAASVAKSVDETASKERGIVIVSQDRLGGKTETTVDYYSNKK